MKQKLNKTNDFLKNNLTLYIIVMFLFVIISFVLVSYSYFTSNIQGKGKQITISRSNLIVHYNNGNEINETGMTNGSTITKTFYVTNNSNTSQTYKLSWQYLVNNFEFKDYLKYTITSTNSGGSLSSTKLPNTGKDLSIINNVSIGAHVTQTYTMTINYTYSSSNKDANKKLIGKIQISDSSGNVVEPETYSGTSNSEIEAEKNLYNFSLDEVFNTLYPIGKIYTSTSSTNPGTLFPGTTWERYGKGKTLVSLDEADTNFNTVEKTGGTKDEVIPYHRHDLNGTNATATSGGAHEHTVTGTASTTGSTHTHTIAANGIQVSSTAQTISTAAPDEVTGEYEDGVNYGEHTHSVTGTGSNSAAYTVPNTNSAHTHKTTATSSNFVPFLNKNISFYGGTSSNVVYNANTSTLTQSRQGDRAVFDIKSDSSFEITFNVTNITGTLTVGICDGTTAGLSWSNSIRVTTTGQATYTVPAGKSSKYLHFMVESFDGSFTIVFGESKSDGAHYHTIASNGLSLTNSSTYTTGNNTNEGNHTHTTTSLQLTTDSESSHTHTIAAKTYSAAGSSAGGHTHSVKAHTAYKIPKSTGTWSAETVGGIGGSGHKMPQIKEANSFTFTKQVTVTEGAAGSHQHTVRIPQHSTQGGSAHTHSFDVPALDIASSGGHKHTIPASAVTSNNTSAIRIPGTSTTDGTHTHAIPALNIASSGAHTHTIPANSISVTITGSTTSDNHAGAHTHTIDIPALTSKNTSAITVPNTSSAHSHNYTGTAAESGAHEHTLSGYSAYAGTSGNATNANLQPYITVYMWRRVS